MPDRAPTRATAAILAFALPPGVGQAYLGLTRRAIVWFVVFFVLSLAVPALLPALGAAAGYRFAGAVWLVAIAARWIAPVVDVLATKEARFRPGSTALVVGLACGGMVAALLSAVATRVLLVEAFKIPSGAMIPTLLVGDHIFVDKLVYRTRAPRRGEVMVFAFPEHREQDFVKRVILLPGDRMDVKQGHPWINGWEVPHCRVGSFSYTGEDSADRHEGDLDVEFLGDEAYLTFYDAPGGTFTDQQGPYRAKPGEYWVLGDNRNNSHDSRMWFGGLGGGVPRDLVRGRGLFLWLSVGDAGVDWSRSGQPVEGPTLPKGSESLRPALDACLASRPPPSRTTPPPG